MNMLAKIERAVKDKTATFEIPTLESVSPAYSDLIAKRDKLWKIQSDLRVDLQGLYERQRSAAATPRAHHAVPGKLVQPSDAAIRVAELLGDKPAEPEVQTPGLDDQARAVKAEHDAVGEALRQLEQRIRAEQYVASDLVCEIIEPEMRRLTTDAIGKTLALHAANVALTAFADDLNSKKILWSRLNPCFPQFAGPPNSISSGLAHFLIEAVEGGWLEKLPKEFTR
jgi:hypothetical protein